LFSSGWGARSMESSHLFRQPVPPTSTLLTVLIRRH